MHVRWHVVAVLALTGWLPIVFTAPDGRQSQATGSISGRVTLDGRPAAGVKVTLMLGRQGSAVTDDDGRYVIRDLPPATYRVRPVLAGFTVDGERTYAAVNVASGEAVQRIDFELVPAATISGHVLDAEGQPLNGAAVFVERIDASGRTIEKRGLPFLIGQQQGEFSFSDVQAGAYRVSAQAAPGGQPVRTYYFPGTTSVAGARVVQIATGETLAGIDIRCGLPDAGFVATGRVIDVASGTPMPNIRVTCGAMAGDPERAAAPVQFQTDGQGNFAITGLRSASYWVAVQNSRTGALYSRPQLFSVAGGDVRGLDLTMLRGVSLGGRFVFQADAAASARPPVERFAVAFWPKAGEAGPFPERVRSTLIKQATIREDGTFLIEGVPPGLGSLSLHYADSFQPVGDYSVRIERAGTDISREFDVKGEVGDITIILVGGHAVIRGHVLPSGGALPVRQLEVWLQSKNSTGALTRRVTLNPDGAFVAEGLPSGEYDVFIVAHLPPNIEKRTGEASHVRLGADDTLTVDLRVTIPLK